MLTLREEIKDRREGVYAKLFLTLAVLTTALVAVLWEGHETVPLYAILLCISFWMQGGSHLLLGATRRIAIGSWTVIGGYVFLLAGFGLIVSKWTS